MQVTFNKSSWHTRYYKWIFQKTELPKSLCPYFWSMVAGVLLFPFFLFIKIVVYFIDKSWEKKMKRTEEENERRRKRSKLIEKIAIIIGKILLGFLIGLVLLIIGVLIYDGVNKVGWLKVLESFLIIIGSIASFAGIIILIINISEPVGDFFKRLWNSSPIQTIRGMVSGFFEKVCPIINWTENLDVKE